jgi:hypothetical protein
VGGGAGNNQRIGIGLRISGRKFPRTFTHTSDKNMEGSTGASENQGYSTTGTVVQL